jgi:hypothetical protein
MKNTTKAHVIAISVLGLAICAAPASMILNAPDANARVAHPAPSASETYVPAEASVLAPPAVVELDEVKVVANPKPATSARPAAKKAPKKWTCRRIPLAQNRPALATKDSAPATQSVQLCEWL